MLDTNWNSGRNLSDEEIEQETTCWYDLLSETYQKTKEDVDSLVTTLSDKELHRTFFCGYGIVEGVPFIAW